MLLTHREGCGCRGSNAKNCPPSPSTARAANKSRSLALTRPLPASARLPCLLFPSFPPVQLGMLAEIGGDKNWLRRRKEEIQVKEGSPDNHHFNQILQIRRWNKCIDL